MKHTNLLNELQQEATVVVAISRVMAAAAAIKPLGCMLYLRDLRAFGLTIKS